MVEIKKGDYLAVCRKYSSADEFMRVVSVAEKTVLLDSGARVRLLDGLLMDGTDRIVSNHGSRVRASLDMHETKELRRKSHRIVGNMTLTELRVFAGDTNE